jgi:hypothetical protein
LTIRAPPNNPGFARVIPVLLKILLEHIAAFASMNSQGVSVFLSRFRVCFYQHFFTFSQSIFISCEIKANEYYLPLQIRSKICYDVSAKLKGTHMKKFLVIPLLLALVACGGWIKPEAGSENLTRLESEPTNCQFMYRLEVEVSVYHRDDAERYLRNRIVDQHRRGNAYHIVSQHTRPNQWVLFGPERAFVISANVYDCP